MESLHLIQDGLLQCNKNDSIIKNDTRELQELLEGKKKLLANGYKVKTHYGGGGALSQHVCNVYFCKMCYIKIWVSLLVLNFHRTNDT
jgi:hypothetical protein